MNKRQRVLGLGIPLGRCFPLLLVTSEASVLCLPLLTWHYAHEPEGSAVVRMRIYQVASCSCWNVTGSRRSVPGSESVTLSSFVFPSYPCRILSRIELGLAKDNNLTKKRTLIRHQRNVLFNMCNNWDWLSFQGKWDHPEHRFID